MSRITPPSWLGVVTATGAGLLQFFNVYLVHLGSPWHTLVLYGLTLLTGIAISPQVNVAFRNAVHWSLGVTTSLTAIVMGLQAVALTLHPGTLTLGIVQGVLTTLAGLGFGSAGERHMTTAL